MNLADFVRDPLEIIAVWHGGMSFHGGLIGTATAGWWFCKRKALPFWDVADSVIVTVPIGLGLGRIGDFINGEFYGRVTELPWGMIFPEGDPLSFHPSQLYEAFMEGVVLRIVLWILHKIPVGPLIRELRFRRHTQVPVQSRNLNRSPSYACDRLKLG